MNLPDYNQHFINQFKATGLYWTDAQAYNLTVTPADSYPCWRLIGVHHLTNQENVGKHHAFCDVLDENGKRVNQARLAMRQSNGTFFAVIDKPAHEAGTNFPLWSEAVGALSVIEPVLPSDEVQGIRSTWGDEGTGTTWGHHSFYFVFQKVLTGSTPPPEEPPEEPDPPPTDPAYTITSRIAYDITGANGDFLATTTSLPVARQIVASLVLFQASSRDSRLEEYVKAIEKWQRGER